jgi:glycosyltransferase involved in cell wall biosynthesis
VNSSQVGAVIIGRNEGQRLINCIESLKSYIQYIVYVDSGSTDNSVQEAINRDVNCVSLDLNIAFTAARARNEGAKYLVDNYPDIGFIQFIDGDCEVHSDWVDEAYKFLLDNDDYAVACGRRRERFPEHSIYNQLCDIEWNTPIGDAKSCGGDALIRVSAFTQVDGYNGTLIAGEEPEMCFRLREKGWKLVRLDIEMTLHDAAMIRVGQWWNRARRAGFAYAQGYYLHGQSADKYNCKPTMSILLWGGVLPLSIILLSLLDPLFLLLFICYPLQIFRLSIKNISHSMSIKNGFYYAVSNVCGKFPQFIGGLRFVKSHFQGRQSSLIEYK